MGQQQSKDQNEEETDQLQSAEGTRQNIQQNPSHQQPNVNLHPQSTDNVFSLGNTLDEICRSRNSKLSSATLNPVSFSKRVCNSSGSLSTTPSSSFNANVYHDSTSLKFLGMPFFDPQFLKANSNPTTQHDKSGFRIPPIVPLSPSSFTRKATANQEVLGSAVSAEIHEEPHPVDTNSPLPPIELPGTYHANGHVYRTYHTENDFITQDTATQTSPYRDMPTLIDDKQALDIDQHLALENSIASPPMEGQLCNPDGMPVQLFEFQSSQEQENIRSVTFTAAGKSDIRNVLVPRFHKKRQEPVRSRAANHSSNRQPPPCPANVTPSSAKPSTGNDVRPPIPPPQQPGPAVATNTKTPATNTQTGKHVTFSSQLVQASSSQPRPVTNTNPRQASAAQPRPTTTTNTRQVTQKVKETKKDPPAQENVPVGMTRRQRYKKLQEIREKIKKTGKDDLHVCMQCEYILFYQKKKSRKNKKPQVKTETVIAQLAS